MAHRLLSPPRILACLWFAVANQAFAAPATRPAVSFTRDVAPILLQQCNACHNADKAKGGYRLDTFERLLAAGEGKKSPVAAGHADASELYRRLTLADEDDRMPQKADPLPAAQIALIKRWIDEGAPFDGADRGAALASQVVGDPQGVAPQVYPRPVPISALAFTPDGRRLAAGGYHEVTLWDAIDGKPLGRIPKLPQRIYALDFSPDGKTLAVAGGTPGISGQVHLCDVEKLTARQPLDRIGDVMLAARFSPDGAQLAVGGADNAVRLYDPATGKRTAILEQHADWVVDLAFAPDGGAIVTASRDKSARVFDAKTGATRAAFLAHEQPVTAVAFDPKGATAFSVARGDGKIRIWATAGEAKETAAIPLAEPADVTRMLVVAGTVITGGANGSLKQYSVEKRKVERTMATGGQAVFSLAIDLKGKRIASGDQAGVVQVYDLERGVEVNRFVAAPGFKASPP